VDAVEAGLRALHHRDLSAADLDRRLAAKGFGEAERESALETLARTGLLDDRRFAEARAAALAARGAGDALVRHELVRAGVGEDLVTDAIALLEPESERALRIAERRGPGQKTVRYLSGKGFSEDSLSALAGRLVASANEDELG
jgi:regulatory protein